MAEGDSCSPADAFERWEKGVRERKAPVRWKAGVGVLAEFPVAPRRMTVIGGPPGGGKTVIVNQLAIDAARYNPDLRVLVTSCEMGRDELLDRQLARLSGIAYSAIRDGVAAACHPCEFDEGIAMMRSVFCDRVAVRAGLRTIEDYERAVDEHRADLVVVDYLQRVGCKERTGDKRGEIEHVLNRLRAMALGGRGLIVVSAVGRQMNASGRAGYDNLSLASFKESGDIRPSSR